jgi:hypothetical protein
MTSEVIGKVGKVDLVLRISLVFLPQTQWGVRAEE